MKRHRLLSHRAFLPQKRQRGKKEKKRKNPITEKSKSSFPSNFFLLISPLKPPARTKSFRLVRLTAIRPAPFGPLLHAGAEIDIDARRDGETEGLGDLLEVELVDVEDAAERVGSVGLEVGAVAFFRGL